MGSANKAASGVVWSIMLNIATAVYGFVSVPLLIDYFGKAQYGLIGLAASVNVYIQLLDMGMGPTNVRFFANWMAKGNTDEVKRLFHTSLGLYLIVGGINTIILSLLAIFCTDIFKVSPEEGAVLRQLLWILAVTATGNWCSACLDQLVSAGENVAWIKRRAFIPKMLMIIVLTSTIVFRLNIITYSLLSCLATFSTLPLTINKIRRDNQSIGFKIRLHKDIIKTILPYSANIFSLAIFQFSFFQLRPVLLGIKGGATDVADYSIMAGIAALSTMVGGTFMNALLPSSAKAVAEGNVEAYYRVAYQGTKFSAAVYCFCVFGLISILPNLIRAYVGDGMLYLEPWLAAWLILSIGGHNNCISSLILSGENIRPISRMSAVSSIVGLVATWLFIPKFGAGAAVIGLLAYTMGQQLFFYCYYWPSKMNIDSGKVLKESVLPYICIGAILALTLRHMPHFINNWTNIFFFGACFAIGYAALCYAVFDAKDREFIKTTTWKMLRLSA